MVQQVKPLNLQGDRSDCDDGVKSFAEFSRPARELKVTLSNRRRKPGGPNMSVRAIVRELRHQDHALFSKLNPNTVDSWIDQSDGIAYWLDKILVRAKRGNDPGHSNGGRNGVFVSKLKATVLKDSHID